jgi:hypothetical protein
METAIVNVFPRGNYREAVAERLATHQATVEARLERINRRAAPLMAKANADVAALFRSPRSLAYKIPAFWRVADDVMAVNGDDVACKRGCAHCCHIAVLISEDEAKVIGERIGRKPRAVPGRKDAKGFDFGYHNPCTFLSDRGECSIYENRPLACRLQYSLDTDALLCELLPPEASPVPYLNPHPFLMAFLQMLGVPERMPKLGDIREFFPPKK